MREATRGKRRLILVIPHCWVRGSWFAEPPFLTRFCREGFVRTLMREFVNAFPAVSFMTADVKPQEPGCKQY